MCCPKVGGADVGRAGVSDAFTGKPVPRYVPTVGCGSRTTWSRAAVHGSAYTSSISLIGAAGMPAASKDVIHSAAVRVNSTGSKRVFNASR